MALAIPITQTSRRFFKMIANFIYTFGFSLMLGIILACQWKIMNRKSRTLLLLAAVSSLVAGIASIFA
jgi:hypothetical protein